MANTLYPAFADALGDGSINLNTADIRAILVDLADYTYSSAHDHLNDVPSGARVATSASLTQTWASGVLDIADFAFTSVTGDPVEALILYIHDGGADSARRLICFLDTGISGIPATPNGSNINIAMNASGLFSMVS